MMTSLWAGLIMCGFVTSQYRAGQCLLQHLAGFVSKHS